MVDLTFKNIFLPGSAPGYWKWELYVEGDEIPVAAGFTTGTQADFEATILRTQQFVSEHWKSARDAPEQIEPPRFTVRGLRGVKLRFGPSDIG